MTKRLGGIETGRLTRRIDRRQEADDQRGARHHEHGERLDPATDGRPDPRPSVRENSPLLGNLVRDFDFRQQPRAAMLLKQWPGFSERQPR